MALQFKLPSTVSDDYEAAYARIRRVVIDSPVDRPPHFDIQIEVFANESARKAGKRPVSTMDFTMADAAEVTREEDVKGEDGKPTGEKETVVVTPASTAFSDMLAKVGTKDPVAIAYEALAARPEFKDAKAV